jgi:DNA-directed RNA polymerase specialized sigma24 family protein
MWAGERYRDDFEGMVDVVYRVHNGLPVRPRTSYERALRDQIVPLEKHGSYTLNRDDIAQQLSLIWHKCLVRRGNKAQGIRTFLLRLAVFELRDWYRKEVRSLSEDPRVMAPGRSWLGLHWLLYDDEPGYTGLTPYQRYLILLHFAQGLNILEISKLIHKDRHMISKALNEALKTLRSRQDVRTTPGRYRPQ